MVPIAIALKGADDLIGDCALKVARGDARQAEIGFTLSRAYQGKGYAAEAVSRLLDWAFGELDLHRVVAITDQRNEPFSRLLERLGMRREAASSLTRGLRGMGQRVPVRGAVGRVAERKGRIAVISIREYTEDD